MGSDDDDRLWYVAFGSNMAPEGLGRYVAGGPATVRALPRQTVRLPHRLYFAGRSRRWGGGVAFLDPRRDPTAATPGVARLLTRGQFEGVIRQENGRPEFVVPAEATRLAPRERYVLDVPRSADGTLGKYNCVLRLDDLDGLPAYTVTTALDLEPAEPAPDYLALIHLARRSHPGIVLGTDKAG